MKNAEEILNEILKEHSIEIGGLEFIDKDSCLKAMKIYANQKLDEAAEKAKYKYIEINGHLGSSIIEESILSLKDQI